MKIIIKNKNTGAVTSECSAKEFVESNDAWLNDFYFQEYDSETEEQFEEFIDFRGILADFSKGSHGFEAYESKVEHNEN
jgi:hypothetical protein